MSNILEEIIERHPLEHSYAEDGRYAWPERWKEAKEAFAALEAKLEAFQRLLKAAQAEWAYRAPKHDYAWADSARYALIRQEFVDAVVEATLLDAGYNPDEVGQRMAEVARKAIAAAQEEQT